MVGSVGSSASLIAQLSVWMQQHQALTASIDTAQNGSSSSGAVKNVGSSGTVETGATYSTSTLGSDSLLVLLQSQHVAPTTTTGSPNDPTGQPSTFRQDFQNLVAAIKSGDLTGAQTAYTALSQLQPAGTSGHANSFQQALTQIGNDLQAGNMQGAQQTLGSLPQHHQGGGGPSASASDTVTKTMADGSTVTITTNADGSISTTTKAAASTSSGAADNLFAAFQQAWIG